ncbi:hypothetical protein F5884DRAFT_751339 [Xylogone sp. PMI_703]|nr:hypothetical protein F5884DRAFT_751339 [Xylogone sp. PMI_703]
MKLSPSSFALIASLLSSTVDALGQKATVTFTAGNNLLQLGADHTNTQLMVSANDWWGAIRAAEDLAYDFGRVTHKNLTLINWNGTFTGKRNPATHNLPVSSGHNLTSTSGGKTTVIYTYQPPTSDITYKLGPSVNITGPTLLDNFDLKTQTTIIAGTIGKSDVIDAIIASGKLDASPIQGKWESFVSEVIESPVPGVSRAMVIAGSDMRGTIFGLYDVSEQIGVSPWYWWADVPAVHNQHVYALGVRKVQGPPSIKYRGLFINDEQPALTNWINDNYAPGKYGPGFNHYFHSNVFELLLRLRANYFWPAQWASMFNVDDYENQPIADAYGIVMGTSHTEPMMRATNEWNNFGHQYGGNGQWEYDTNNASLIPFFVYGAQRAKPYGGNSLFTMAMRGSGDTAIQLSTAEAIQVVTNVVNEQTKILEQVFPETNVTDIPQMWCLYKEVQGYYEGGMTVPDQITLLWADDNWGNVRRLPLANETSRLGGAGVYYHMDYVGDPRDYKWINTIQLEKTVEQMQLAYKRQADRIWILNVGDLKPLEIPINHFMDMAYDTPLWDYDSVPRWLKLWAAREFGADLAEDIASVVDRYGMYVGRRKYELIDPTTYSVNNYNEADVILQQWDSLATDAQAIYDKLGHDAKPAFYQLVLQPVLGGQVVNQVYIYTGRNWHYVQQKRNSANDMADAVLKYFKQDHTLTQRYHDLLDGKWNHILDQTHFGYDYWQQPMRNALPPLGYVQELETSLAGNIGVGVEASNATVSGDDNYHALSSEVLSLPPMDPYGPKQRWIDIFARGTSGCGWTIQIPVDYVTATPSTGYTGENNGTDTRVYVTVDWSKVPSTPASTTITMNITSSCGAAWGNYGRPQVQLPISVTSVPSSFAGFVESDKHIAIEAEHTTHQTTVNGLGYTVLAGHGRTRSGVMLSDPLADTQPAGKGPVLEYSIYTFTNTSKANVTLYISPSLNQNGNLRPLRYAIAVDDEAPQTIQFVPNASNGNLPVGWTGAVADSIWGLSSGKTTTTTHDLTKTGAHTLKIWSVEPAVIFQKIVIDLGGVRSSYLGPPESFRAGVDKVGSYDGTNFAGIALASLDSTS